MTNSSTPPTAASGAGPARGGGSGIAACVGLSLALSAGFFFGGAFVAFLLMVILNGFSERQAMPIFVAYGVLWCVVTSVVIGLACARTLAGRGVLPPRRTRLAATFGAIFTLLPIGLAAGYLGLGHLGIL